MYHLYIRVKHRYLSISSITDWTFSFRFCSLQCSKWPGSPAYMRKKGELPHVNWLGIGNLVYDHTMHGSCLLYKVLFIYFLINCIIALACLRIWIFWKLLWICDHSNEMDFWGFFFYIYKKGKMDKFNWLFSCTTSSVR